MISLPIGVILTALVLFLSIGQDSLGLFFNVHSLLIVGGGTFSILFFSCPQPVLANLIRELSPPLEAVLQLGPGQP